jgi:D-3-phosphoglycerate dehydrogenase
MATHTVLVTDFTWDSTEIEERVLADVDARVLVAETGAEAELLRLAEQADAILTCFAQVTPAVVAAAPRLQVVGRYGIGTDNIAVDEATRRGIPVTNVPAYCVDEVAEHVLALLLCLVRGIHRYDRAIRDGDWSLSTGLPTRRVAGTTLGIVGFGRIGRALAERARALGMLVIAYESYAPDAVAAFGAESVTLDELAQRSDFVSLHCPANEETRGLIDAAFLGRMKPTAYLINAARGAIVDQEALTEALSEGRIAGAGLDVFVPERLPPDHPLLRSERLLATPHTAFYSEESVADLASLAAQNVAAILDGRCPLAIVNPEVLELPRWAHLR